MPDEIQEFIRNIYRRWGWPFALFVTVLLAILAYLLFRLLNG